MKGIISVFLALLHLLTGCADVKEPGAEPERTEQGYFQITQEEAKARMAREDGHVVVDVRRPEEFAQGHIPGAICIPNESILEEKPQELPDLEQVILVYCRSGNRSKQAAQKLSAMGYTQVYEFGGILEWNGDVVTEEEADNVDFSAELTFGSFGGGGPEYSIQIEDEELLTYQRSVDYYKADHENLPGAGYDVIYRFRGLKPGETTLTVSARSPIADNYDQLYKVLVDEELQVTLTEGRRWDPYALPQTPPVLVIQVNGTRFYALLEENDAAQELITRLTPEPLTLELHDYGNFEKVGPLPFDLPREDEPITTEPGDILLYQGNQLTLYYDENSWSFTRLAKIPNTDREELLEALGEGDVVVELWLEWEE